MLRTSWHCRLIWWVEGFYGTGTCMVFTYGCFVIWFYSLCAYTAEGVGRVQKETGPPVCLGDPDLGVGIEPIGLVPGISLVWILWVRTYA